LRRLRLPAGGTGALSGGRRAALQIGLAAGLAFSACYATYTHVHHIIHHEPPATSAGRWVRKHHLAHHFSTPKRNFGVTHGWWDVALGTAKTPDQLKVPRRLAPSWLVDETGGGGAHARAAQRHRRRHHAPLRGA